MSREQDALYRLGVQGLAKIGADGDWHVSPAGRDSVEEALMLQSLYAQDYPAPARPQRGRRTPTARAERKAAAPPRPPTGRDDKPAGRQTAPPKSTGEAR